MSEPDDVERLVERVTDGSAMYPSAAERLARIVRELLAEHVAGPCINGNIRLSCSSVWPKTQQLWCEPCFDRALRERLNKIARGEEA